MTQTSLFRCLRAPLALALFSCNPQVPIPHRLAPGPATADAADEGGVVVTAEPPAPLDSLPVVLRLHVTAGERVIDPAAVVLVQGAAGPAHLRQVQRGELSAALTKRLVPAVVFPAPPSEDAAAPSGVVVAPTVTLAAGERYALLIGEPPAVVELMVAESDPVPVLERLWPPLMSSATANLGIWCGAMPLAALDEPLQLAPDNQQGRMQRGVVEGDGVQRCVRFETPPGASAEGGVPPPVLPHNETTSRLDPRPLTADADRAPIASVPCAMDEIVFGPGCVKVFDDRIAGRSPDAAALWSIQGAGMERIFATTAGEPFVLAPLMASSSIALSIDTIDNGGEASRATFSALTLPPMPHLILNEVLANPIGPEPAQEWVEIVNDGAAPAELVGYMLIDIGGETPLPPVTLQPGRFALIVNETFVESDGYDVPPAPSTQILRVPKLGQGGLANGGEPLLLRAPDGAVVSRFPLAPKPKAGMSVSRRAPGEPDARPQAFLLTTPTPGQPNEP